MSTSSLDSTAKNKKNKSDIRQQNKAKNMDKNLKKAKNREEAKSSDKQTRPSLWKSFIALDEEYTLMCSVCSSAEARFGKYRPVMKLLEMSCHGIPWLSGTVLLLTMSHRENDIEFYVNLFLALIFDLIVVGVLKAVSRRSRPPCNKMDMFATVSVDNFSFPSGHTTRAAMMAFLFLNKLSLTVTSSFILIFWSVIVACSRICLGRHHISDVICGYLIGILQYYVFITYLWLPPKTCLQLLEPFHGHFHL